MPQVVLRQHVLIGDGDFRPEGRVGENQVELIPSVGVVVVAPVVALLDAGSEPHVKGFDVVPVGRLQVFERVELENIGVTITGHDHVHAGCPLEVGVEVNAKQVLLGVSGDGCVHVCLVAGVVEPGTFGTGVQLLPNLTAHMVEHHHEETATSAGGVEYPVVWLRVEHFHHQPHDIAGREELPPLLLEGIGNDGLVSHALHVHRGVEEGVAG